ncbi:uncharacterized protein BYT42DRAFT_572998 [Radiomyces spectabilis]|uniref:uncharacterized protein n=1 Tax=Radiomyces spectabilis TaxID=64574 RepID=UPI0022206BA3|nr:uncharacterized protein BYT42DRAFT_572998 [Radiomyces spectabilis]KAI8375989.1 hypothetical protein BYT42DRAFT_572998 [Radiomyces spectabilis]
MNHHHQQHPFQEAFWSPTASIDPYPNFSVGLRVLHEKLVQSIEENQLITDYLQRRIAAEEAYGQHLCTVTPPSTGIAFDRDVGAGLRKCFEIVSAESAELAQGHKVRAENLKTMALDPLQRFAGRYEKLIHRTKAVVHERIHQFELLVRIVEQTKNDYIAKCQAVRNLRSCPVDPDIADKIQRHLQALAENIQCHWPTSLITGDTVFQWIRSQLDQQEDYVYTDDQVLIIAQLLVSQGYLCSSRPTENFEAQPNYAYEKRDGSNHNTCNLDHPVNLCIIRHAGTGTSQSTSGLLGRWQQKSHKEPWHKFLHGLFMAEKTYRESVAKAEKMRMQTQETLLMHFEEMESLELERIQTIKQAFISVAATLSNTIPLCKEMYDRMMLYQETLNPEKDVQFIVEQYHTGRFCPRPIIYENHYHGAIGQIFGTRLEDLVRQQNVLVPPIMTEGLKIIEQAMPRLHQEEKSKVWTAKLPFDRVHTAREEINDTLHHTTIGDRLRSFDLLLVASLLRLYLMELPDCLLTFELYETVKVLYANQEQDEKNRLASISKLLTTLPTANYYTLEALMAHFHKLTSTSEDTQLVHQLAATFGYILIRSQIESTINVHDRHPQRLVRELIVHFPTIFTEEAHKAQEEHSTRRAIIAPHPVTLSKEPSLDAPSFISTVSSSGSSLQSPAPTDTVNGWNDQGGHKESLDSKAAPTARRRTFLSFMRRNSPGPTQPTVTRQEHETESKASAMVRRPVLPMPSTSTLFVDPDDQMVTAIPKPAGHAGGNDAPPCLDDMIPTLETSTRAEPPDISKKTRSRSTTLTQETDDHVSLDSFFDDE